MNFGLTELLIVAVVGILPIFLFGFLIGYIFGKRSERKFWSDRQKQN